MTSHIVVHRVGVASPDAYDRHDAIVKIDGAQVGSVPPGSTASFAVDAGKHQVSFRLQYNFGTAKTNVDVPEGASVQVTAQKARSARNSIPPSRYWRSTVAD
jgi:hypothetical protein